MSKISSLTYRVVRRPMKTTFATSLGAKKAATSVLVRVSLSDGREGLGEVPTSFVMPHETTDAISAVLRRARERLAGTRIADYPGILAQIRREHPAFHMTLAGLEVALFRAALQRDADILSACGEDVSSSLLNHGKTKKQRRNDSDADKMSATHAGKMPASRSEWQHWGGKLTRIETDITIPFVPSGDELALWLSRVVRQGFTTYKIKVSGKIDQDMAFLKAAREILRASLPQFVIRLDGNQGYTARSYGRMVASIEKADIDIELFEQPLHKADLAGLKRIRGIGAAPVILDETIFTAEDCRRAIDRDLADGVNVKIAKSGLAEACRIVRLARKAKWKLMIGCMTETMVGLAAGIRLAAGMGVFDYVDLDSIHFLHHGKHWQDITICTNDYLFDL